MSLNIGTCLGPYEITALVGTGGMGEVYRGRDTRLDRVVAVKVIRDAATASATARQRFDQEARAIASLSHPHICTLYDVGHSDGTDFLVMEYLAGETLAGRLSRQATRPSGSGGAATSRGESGGKAHGGPAAGSALPLEETLRIATQLADALVAAHRAGVIHRDLKPGNIMLTPSGVKVLDFGLAKLRPPADQPFQTRTASLETQAGMLVGTVPYMAPEQLSEGIVDARTDIFAFGAIVYELASGRRPFTGASQASLIAAILDRDPEPITTSEPLTPPGLERLVRKCLAKDPATRWQSASDMVDELRWLSSGSVDPAPAPRTRRTWFTRLVVAGVVVLIVGAGGAGAWRLRGRRAAGQTRLQLQFTQATFRGSLAMAAISPDGRSVTYAMNVSGDEVRVFVQDLGGGPALEVWKGTGAQDLTWMPNSSQVLVANAPNVWLVSRFGGNARRVAGSAGAYVALSPDGSKVLHASGLSGGFEVTPLDGTASLSVKVDGIAWISGIDWNAVTNRISLLGKDEEQKNGIWSVLPDGADLRRIYSDPLDILAMCSSPVAGALYVLHESAGADELVKLPLAAGPQSPDPMVLGRGLHSLGGGCSVSADGRRFLFVQGLQYANVWRMDRGPAGPHVVAVTRGTAWFTSPRISPDERWILVSQWSLAQGSSVVKIPLAGGEPVTLGEGCCSEWSPDGQRIAFGSQQNNKWTMQVSDADRLHPVAVSNRDNLGSDLTWLPDGRLGWHSSDGNFHIHDPVSGRDEVLELPAPGGLGRVRFSRALDQVAFSGTRVEPGIERKLQMWLLSWPSRVTKAVLDGLVPIGWSRDGSWVYAEEEGGTHIVRVSSRSFKVEPVGQFPIGVLAWDGCSLSPQESSIVCAMSERTADAWTIDDFDPGVPAGR